jgi:hypothetical protein
MPHSTLPAGSVLEIPGKDSEEMQTVHIVLGVLSLYWQPLRKLVCYEWA